MKIVDTHEIIQLIHLLGEQNFSQALLSRLQTTFEQWHKFTFSPRNCTHFDVGVIELMPCADDVFYSCKYVNGHPQNPQYKKLSVAALGLLADVATGYPILLTDMTLLTAFRTAATSALAAKYLAKSDSSKLAIIGTGAQSEFQVKALCQIFPIQQVRYYDQDMSAMTKFAINIQQTGIRLIPCKNINELLPDNDIIITATARKQKQNLISQADLYPGLLIIAIGGDCPGKTELNPDILSNNRVVVEYLPQSKNEGEIQTLNSQTVTDINHAPSELWQIVSGKIQGRSNEQDIIVFDSVGIALEDFATLTLVNELVEKYKLGTEHCMIPEPVDPKNLYGLLS
ncbi:MAG: ornithine cyclodeaminase [Paraglaciecola sp.]|jgi:ornithine cyclodeaminase